MFIINISVQVFYIMVKKFFVCFGHVYAAAVDLECLFYSEYMIWPYFWFTSKVYRSNYSATWFHNRSRLLASTILTAEITLIWGKFSDLFVDF